MNTKKEILLKATYDALINVGFFNHPIAEIEHCFSESFMAYGTTRDEKVFGSNGFRWMLVRQRKELEDVELHIRRFPITREEFCSGNAVLMVEEIEMSITEDGIEKSFIARMSTVLEYRSNQWMILHFHGSTADANTQHGEAWPIEEWKRRNAELQKMVDEKAADLILKNRELEIESSLERVRSQTMAMQKSDELFEVIKKIYDEFQKMGFDALVADLMIFTEDKKGYDIWVSGRYGAEGPYRVGEAFYNHPHHRGTMNAWLKGEQIRITELNGEMFTSYFEIVLNNITGLQNLSKEDKNKIFSLGQVVQTEVFTKHGCIRVGGAEKRTAAQLDIQKRFATVFDQTYTRFLDLKQAEAQAREARIEAALEKVRSQTMAMHQSVEIAEVASVVFQQLTKLGLSTIRCWVSLIDAEKEETELWVTSVFAASAHPVKIILPLKNSNQQLLELVEKWKNGAKYLEYALTEGEAAKYNRALRELSGDATLIPDEFMKTDFPDYFLFEGCHKYGTVGVSSFEPFSKEIAEVLQRFAAVFEQSYTRFLDLQKAEAQVREAQIETSLEKVRSRSMAMHQSNDLHEVLKVVAEQLLSLGLKFDAVNFARVSPEGSWNLWLSTPEQSYPAQIHVPYLDHKIFNQLNEIIIKEVDFYTDIYSYEEKNIFFNHFFKNTIAQNISEARKQYVLNSKGFARSVFLMKNIWLSVGNYEAIPYTDEENLLLKRFANVFEQSYTRFLDLQKAEAQAREAQIELGLERVRARAMAMQNSEELAELVDTVFKELRKLDFSLTRCIIWIFDNDATGATVWSANSEIDKTPRSYYIKFLDHPRHQTMISEWKARTAKFIYELKGDEKKTNDYRILHETELRHLPEEVKAGMMESERVFVNYSFSNFGCLQVDTLELLPEDNREIIYRFAKVFDLTYTRFHDLQKAEAQAREAQIELGLERVRARAMAMHSSDELNELVKTLFEELIRLDVRLSTCMIWTCNPATLDARIWIFHPVTREPNAYKVQYNEDPFYLELLRAWNERNAKWIYCLEGDAKVKWEKFLFSETGFSLLPEVVKDEMRKPDRVFFSASYYKSGAIQAAGLEPFSEQNIDILQRFSKVFDLSYTRFLDLKQAKAQAREAQIEAALERVRSRTMAMHQSTELGDVATVLFQQLRQLGGNVWTTGIGLCKPNSSMDEFWLATEGGLQPPMFVPNTEDLVHKKMYEGWKNKIDFYSEAKDGDALKAHYNYMLSVPALKPVFENIIASGFALPTWQKWHAAYFSHGYLLIITLEPYPEEQVFKRFAKVFEQTYTRFLDLQKAEAQAREAQIEIALERVRSRTLAMHKSDELGELSFELVKQVQALGIATWHCAFNIYDEDQKGSTEWGSNAQGSMPIYKTPREGIFLRYYEAGKRGETLHIEVIGEKECADHYAYLCTLPVVGEILLKVRDPGVPFPKSQIDHVAYFKYGYLLFITFEPAPEAHDIFKRFAKVFEQTYTRFLDLQKAEAQAREAQIEAALERVRSRTMGMQKSEELKEVIQVVYEQFVHLNIKIEHTGFVIDYKARDDYDIWIADPLGVPSQVTIPYFDSVYYNRFNEAKEKGEDFFATNLSFEEKNKFYQKLFEYVPGLPEEAKEFYFSCPGLAASTVLLDNVGLYIENFSGIPYSDDENKTLMRFGKVFQQTYTRFNDLKQAEEQARESQIQLGLERVRARAMAMQKSEELKELIGTVFIELTKLDLVLTRCLIMIYDTQTNDSTWWMANSEAPTEPIGLLVKYHQLPPYTAYLSAWQERKNKWQYILQATDKKDWDDFLFVETELSHLPDFVIAGMKAPDRVYLNASFNNFGNLTLASLEPLSNEHFDILLRFAKVFDLTYTRFNDLQKAESQIRESQVQLALERVRAKTMAMQKPSGFVDVINVVGEQFINLGFDFDWVNFSANGHDVSKAIDIWNFIVVPGVYQGATRLVIPFFDHPVFTKAVDSVTEYYTSGEEFSVVLLNKKDKDNFLDHLFTNTIYKDLSDDVKTSQYIREAYLTSNVVLKDTWLSVGKYDTKPFTEEQNAILKRLASAFGQAYTRFLDLQKAEAQAREAQIEAALERVRYKAMAMQSSEDVGSATAVVFNEMSLLGVETMRCGITIIRPDQTADVWAATTTNEGKAMKGVGSINLQDHPLWTGMFNAWHDKEDNFSYHLKGADLKAYYKVLVNSPNYSAPYLKEELPEHFFYASFFEEGAVFTFSLLEHNEENQKVLKKFTAVFSLTFRRYQDLQKAEAQAREAKIEASLERVRSRTLAMHKSDELAETAAVLFKQMIDLGIAPNRLYIGIINDESGDLEFWITDEDGNKVSQRYMVNVNKNISIKKMYEGWAARKKSITVDMQGQELVDWLTYWSKEFHVPFKKGAGQNRRVQNISYFSKGFIAIASPDDQAEETTQLLERFAAVFNLTYTRFNDLQMAEAQAREAQIEAALERVRSRTLAMQKSDELAETAAVLFQQLILLGIEPNRLYIGIVHDERGDMEMWATDEDGSRVGQKFMFNKKDNASVNQLYQGWKEKMKTRVVDMQGKELEDYFYYLKNVLDVPFKGGLSQKRRVQSVAFFGQGFIGVASPEPLNDDTLNLLERFASVFNLTYTRFNDLQIAEAHAVQAEQDLIAIKAAKQKAEEALSELQVTQKQLIQSEKMASLGELTAGIAHEIQNPLNFVNNFSEVSNELIEELKIKNEKLKIEDAEVNDLLNDLSQNLEKINHHGKRADSIVKGMLQHSRSGGTQKEKSDINALADEYLRLAYHGLRAKDKSFNAKFETDFDSSLPKINIIPQDIGRVILNLINNAFYAASQPSKGGLSDSVSNKTPTIWVRTKKLNNKVLISVKDTGPGIPANILDKIFQPFFTTKPTGEGTGLGLSLCYDIVKAHGGEIKVETKEGEGSEFIILLPVV